MNLFGEHAGLCYYPGYLDRDGQATLLAALEEVFAAAPPFTPRMPKSGRPFTVRMSNCGPLGWISDENGYRYERAHPVTGRPWPPMPRMLIAIWHDLADYPHAPEACLINFYGPAAKMGLHQDRDEQDFAAPVVSLSLGDSCLFRVGGLKRNDPTRSVRLNSRRVRVRRQRAACVPWSRPHLSGHIDLARWRRTDQSDHAASDTRKG